MKVSIQVNSEKLYQKLEKAIENFKDEESRQLMMLILANVQMITSKHYLYLIRHFSQQKL